MPSTHRTYDKDFRQEAVNLLLSSGRPLKRVAAELGVTANSLRTWRDRAFDKGRVAQAASAEPKGRSEAPLADPAACSVKMNICAASVLAIQEKGVPHDHLLGEPH